MTPEIGQTLREARIARGLELADVERQIRIRAEYLDAIEDERWEVLPGDPYNRGFLTSYAEFLGLDGQALVAEYRRAHPQAGEPAPIPETMLPQRGVLRRSPISPRAAAVLIGLLVAAALAVAAVVGLTGDSGEGGNAAGRSARPNHGGRSQTTTSANEPTKPHSSRVSVELRPTGTVWVCLIDDRGRALVDGETLTADQTRGPFKGPAFKATFGNGSVQLIVDGEPVAVRDAGEPAGYRIKPEGVSELGLAARPTCLR
jgi:cytoskeleton protein RodZ